MQQARRSKEVAEIIDAMHVHDVEWLYAREDFRRDRIAGGPKEPDAVYRHPLDAIVAQQSR